MRQTVQVICNVGVAGDTSSQNVTNGPPYDVGSAACQPACATAIMELEDLSLCKHVWNGVPSICLLIRIW